MSAQGSTLLLLLAALFGLFIGLLLSSLSSGKEGKRKSQPPPEILKEGYGEVARLWYSPGTKKILTEMDGGFYKSVNGLSGEQKAKLKRLIALLNEWLGAEPPVETTPQATVVENTHYQPLPDPVSRENDDFYDKEEGATPVEVAVSPFLPTEEEEADVISELQQSLPPEDEEETGYTAPEAAEYTITQQINAILQEMLQTTDLADKGIRLEENPNHSVDVFVGAEKYSGIEEVPYPQVRSLIHEAVLRWEQETNPQQRLG